MIADFDYKPIQIGTTPEKVIEQLIENLKNGKLEPGKKLPSQRTLAEMFGVGRSSIREALQVLSVMGCLEMIQGKGTFVSKNALMKLQETPRLNEAFQAATIYNLVEARTTLECKIAELAAERAEEKHIVRLKEAVDRLKNNDSNRELFLKADADFHYALMDAANNDVLSELLTYLRQKLLYEHSSFFASSPQVTINKTIETAEIILNSVINSDAEGAVAGMEEHLKEVLLSTAPNAQN